MNKTELDGEVVLVGVVTLTGDELNDMICELEQEEV